MRLLKLFLVILYMSVQLSGETRSASQAWVDNTEAQFSHSQVLLSQQTLKVTDAETPKDPETKHPVLLQSTSVVTAYFPDVIAHTFNGLPPRQQNQLLAAPRAPPAIA
ncbi:hypothetical protein [Rheinheimera texasensis]|uniref:hypothetical protein n=1 Tax=Rheinheimera texasensis TaxID=306205 RepID=UPI0004E154DA|nr:hypothetical protein [Rheinheimera texasensis]